MIYYHPLSIINCDDIYMLIGMILYLREVSKYLALVCVIREEYFTKRSLLDFNINCLRKSLDQVLLETSKV